VEPTTRAAATGTAAKRDLSRLEHPRRNNGPGTHVAHGGAGQASYCCCAEDREKKKNLCVRTCRNRRHGPHLVVGKSGQNPMPYALPLGDANNAVVQLKHLPTLGLSLSSHALGIVRVLLKAKFHTLYRPVTFLGALRVEHLSQTRKIRDHDDAIHDMMQFRHK